MRLGKKAGVRVARGGTVAANVPGDPAVVVGPGVQVGGRAALSNVTVAAGGCAWLTEVGRTGVRCGGRQAATIENRSSSVIS